MMVIGKCKDVFRGICFVEGEQGWRGGGYVGGTFPWRNLPWGKRISVKRVQDFLTFKKK